MKKIICLIVCFIMLLNGILFFDIFAYNDVSPNSWYCEAVEYVTEFDYFTGFGNGKFEPHTTMTRAMFVQVLSKMTKDDTTNFDGSKWFSDVKPTSWYTKAVGWAYESNIVFGTGGNNFSPNNNITRQEICSMLGRFIEHENLALTKSPNPTIFNDDSVISSWAKNSVYDMKSLGVVSGKTNNNFDPKSNATRAEVAVMIYQLDKKIDSRMKLNMDYVDIKIDGVAEPVKLLHISDLHLTLTDDTDSPVAREIMGVRSSLFSSEIPDSIERTTRLEILNQFYLQNNIDMMVMSGDIIDAPSNGNLTYLKNHFSQKNIKSFYIYGNHDWTGDWIDDYQTQNQWNSNTPKFDGIVTTGEDKIAIREYDGFTLIALDNSDDQITLSQYQTLFKYCSKKGANSTPVILMMHVPVNTETMVDDVTAKWGRNILLGSPILNPNSYTQWFVELLKSSDSTVVAILAGHVHMDHVDKISSKNNTIQYTLGATYDGSARQITIHG